MLSLLLKNHFSKDIAVAPKLSYYMFEILLRLSFVFLCEQQILKLFLGCIEIIYTQYNITSFAGQRMKSSTLILDLV